MKIGDIEILPILDGHIIGRLQSTKPLPDEGSSLWQQQHGMFRSGGLIESTVGGFLVRSGDRLVLVDAGLGPAFPDGYSPPEIAVDDDRRSDHRPVAGTGQYPRSQLRRLADDLGQVRVAQGRLPASLRAARRRARGSHGPRLHPPALRPHRMGLGRELCLLPERDDQVRLRGPRALPPGHAGRLLHGPGLRSEDGGGAARSGARQGGDVGDRWRPAPRGRRAPGARAHAGEQRRRDLRPGPTCAAARRHHPLSAGADGRRLQPPGRPRPGHGGFRSRGVRARAGGRRRPGRGEPLSGAAVRPALAGRGHAPLDVRPRTDAVRAGSSGRADDRTDRGSVTGPEEATGAALA